ncbi:hypothetical protein PG994_013936 [Apiospora phragmitis]|uniref:Uncharacterized protein n=1 Tax=Apiospora phragmitis TaxID=2905665 RepID=A0ABR1T2X4_9PEZI
MKPQTTRLQRSIAVFIDAEGDQITNKDDENARWSGRFSAYYGPNSRYNGRAAVNAYSDESHLLYVALSSTLAHFADQALGRRRRRRRRREIQHCAVTNSHGFLRDCAVFRLLVLVNGPGLRKFMPLIGPTAAGPMETEALLAAQAVRWRCEGLNRGGGPEFGGDGGLGRLVRM